jgi:hypothetical protein
MDKLNMNFVYALSCVRFGPVRLLVNHFILTKTNSPPPTLSLSLSLLVYIYTRTFLSSPSRVSSSLSPHLTKQKQKKGEKRKKTQRGKKKIQPRSLVEKQKEKKIKAIEEVWWMELTFITPLRLS